MKKKAQYYMFAAVIFITLLFATFTDKSLVITENYNSPEKYIDNYIYEAKTVINNAAKHNLNISEELLLYSEEFLEYTEEKGQDIELFYAYSNNNELFISNYLKNEVYLPDIDVSLVNGQSIKTGFIYTLNFRYINESYSFQFNHPEEIEIKAMMIKNV